MAGHDLFLFKKQQSNKTIGYSCWMNAKNFERKRREFVACFKWSFPCTYNFQGLNVIFLAKSKLMDYSAGQTVAWWPLTSQGRRRRRRCWSNKQFDSLVKEKFSNNIRRCCRIDSNKHFTHKDCAGVAKRKCILWKERNISRSDVKSRRGKSFPYKKDSRHALVEAKRDRRERKGKQKRRKEETRNICSRADDDGRRVGAQLLRGFPPRRVQQTPPYSSRMLLRRAGLTWRGGNRLTTLIPML